jgi:ABC-2 type transport system ATP-binding protein
MTALLSARALSCGSPPHRRLDAIDLELSAGDRLALLGVNGAGKSTLMQVLAGVLVPDSGSVTVDGRPLHGDSAGPRQLLGYLPQLVPAYPEMTVRENIDLAARLRRVPAAGRVAAIARVVEQTQLQDVKDRQAGQLSAGMLQRVGIAQALVHSPRLLILDEPTAGLDPLQAEGLRQLLAELSSDIALLLATHLLDDVQQLCRRVIFLDSGRKTGEQAVTAETDLLAGLRNDGMAVGAS